MIKIGVGAGLAPPANNNILELNGTEIINSTIANEIQTNESVVIENIDSMQNENIGGENVEIKEEVVLSQMEQDAKNILESKSLIIPLKGTITSRYGPRNPETPTVPKNHTGIDIAVNEGTVFVAAMSGIVQEVSSKRRFRESF